MVRVHQKVTKSFSVDLRKRAIDATGWLSNDKSAHFEMYRVGVSSNFGITSEHEVPCHSYFCSVFSFDEHETLTNVIPNRNRCSRSATKDVQMRSDELLLRMFWHPSGMPKVACSRSVRKDAPNELR